MIVAAKYEHSIETSEYRKPEVITQKSFFAAGEKYCGIRRDLSFNSFILTLERPQKSCTRLAFIKDKQFSYFRNGKEHTAMNSRLYM
jgi:hypothetical protein